VEVLTREQRLMSTGQITRCVARVWGPGGAVRRAGTQAQGNSQRDGFGPAAQTRCRVAPLPRLPAPRSSGGPRAGGEWRPELTRPLL